MECVTTECGSRGPTRGFKARPKTKAAQRAGIDHKLRAQPTAYLGRKPSYDRATFDRIKLALDSASPPSLSAIANAEGLSKQTVFRLKQDPQDALAALAAWGM
jgi:putative DNA-invertase from lambdoid prophage Rac